MKTEHRAIIAIVISVAFFFVYYTYISPQKKTPADAAQTAAVESDANTADAKDESATAKEQGLTTTLAGGAQAAAAGAQADVNAEALQADIPVKTATISNGLVEAQITTDGGGLLSWDLADYHTTTDKTSPHINMAAGTSELSEPLTLMFEDASVSLPRKLRYEFVETGADTATMRWRGQGLEIVKVIKLNEDSYVADVAFEVKNLSDKVFTAKPGLAWSGMNEKQAKRGFFGFLKGPQVNLKQPVYYLDGSAKRKKAEKKEVVTLPGAVGWVGLESRYFVSTVIPRVQGEGLAAQYAVEPIDGGTGLWAGAVEPKLMIAPGETGTANFSVYSGPKDIERLKALDVGLDKAIDYGWFTVIAVPILYLLKFFYSIIHNYGVAIILLTIFVKLLLHPINVKSLKSMKAMQQLQPRLKELQKKYKDDKQKLNQETMQLFRAHKVNPMGGCLPMVLQLPIYIALYKVLWSSIELYHAPFFWFYKDLSAPDPYMITPIVLGVFMLLQQRLMPSASADPAQKKMMMLMPIMFTVFMIFLPVGLVVYILVNTAMSVTQQWMYNKGIGFMDIFRGKAKLKAAKAR